MAIMTRIPTELQAEVIDVHMSNYKQLRAMTRVCRLWRHHCNKYLFHQIQVTPALVQPFAHLISSPFTRQGILDHVSNLWIGGPSDRMEGWDFGTRLEALRRVLAFFHSAPNLSDLTLMKSVSSLFHLGFITQLPLQLPRIQSLHLSDIHFHSAEAFSTFFNTFSTVRYIALKDVTVPNIWSPFQAQTENPTSGSHFTLSLHYNDNGSVSRGLRWKQRTPRISIRDVGVLFSALVASHAPASPETRLSLAGHEFSHIEILVQHCHGYDTWDYPTSKIDLSSAYTLKHLTVGSSRCVLSLMPWMPSLLAQVPETASLKEIRIAFASSRQFDLDQPFIRWLAATINGRCSFQGLKSIHFMAFGTMGDREIEDRIYKTVMSEFMGLNNLVRFSFSP